MTHYTDWLSPLKILETYVRGAPGVSGIEDAKHQLYHAVIDGQVRAQHKGRVLDAESLHEIRSQKWGDEHYDLPSDIKLSIVDAEAVWPESEPTDADLKFRVERKFKALQEIITRLEKGEFDGSFRPFHEYEERWINYARLAEMQIGKIQYSNLRDDLEGRLKDLHKKFNTIEPVVPKPQTSKYERWADRQQQLKSSGKAKHLRAAAKIIAQEEGDVDSATVERETRRVRKEREKREIK
jgi:hypothetical protein